MAELRIGIGSTLHNGRHARVVPSNQGVSGLPPQAIEAAVKAVGLRLLAPDCWLARVAIATELSVDQVHRTVRHLVGDRRLELLPAAYRTLP